MRPPTTLGFLAGQSLRLSEKWVIPADLIEWNSSTKALTLYLRPAPEVQRQCALCEEECPVYDTRAKAWRHLNMWSFETWISAEVPRTRCHTHGVHAVRVPWATQHSRLTNPMNDLASALLLHCTVATVSNLLRLNWDQVKRIKQQF